MLKASNGNLRNKEDNSIENIFKRQLPEGFYKKVFLNISHAEFIIKHRCQSPFFNQITSLRSATLIKERPGRRFFCEFCEIFKNAFFTEHLRVTASDIRIQVVVKYNLNLHLQFCNNKLYIFCSMTFHVGTCFCFNVAKISASICFSIGLFLTMSCNPASIEK